MSTVNSEDANSEGPVESLSLPKRLRRSIASCNEMPEDDVRYLWLNIAQDANGSARQESPLAVSLSEGQWLNVIDEAASLGVGGVVIRLCGALSLVPNLWGICRWAQQTHKMTVGLHLYSAAINDEELACLRKLDTSRTRILVTRDLIEAVRYLEGYGFQLCEADPKPATDRTSCEMPDKMVYVNATGELYTCGLVDGREGFRLGTVFENKFKKILADPGLPHCVPQGSALVSHGCDGCPPLVEKQFHSG